ncbi:MAG: FAD-binding protein [Chloroflexi bacterium]|nr:FAD-binding protein [Chloroflexota bacterium]
MASGPASAEGGARTALPARIISQLREILGPDGVLTRYEDLLVYEYDAYMDRALPEAVIRPTTGQQLAAVVQLAVRERLAITARGGASGLSGGTIPVRGGLVVDLNSMHRILKVDPDNGLALVQPGLINLDLTTAVTPLGLYYAPDPSSQKTSTIGGNIAENSGGPHCLSHGMTTNHIVGLELVTRDGLLCTLGGPAPDAPGYDLVGLAVGSEGTFGVVTQAWVRLLIAPPVTVTFLAAYETIEAAGAAVSALVAAGVVPGALELMDEPSIQALEAAFHVGYPPGAGAILLVDVEGLPEAVEEQEVLVRRICEETPGSMVVQYAGTQAERDKLWAARKGALAACGRVAPNYYLCDGTVPRSKLADVLGTVRQLGIRYGVNVMTVAHIGDGNLHPIIAFDALEEGIIPRVEAAHDELVEACVEAGGTITGEHGVGLEKRKYMPLIFTPHDLEKMALVRDAFNSTGLFNPGKVLPDPGAETAKVAIPIGIGAAIGPDTWV